MQRNVAWSDLAATSFGDARTFIKRDQLSISLSDAYSTRLATRTTDVERRSRRGS
jgi:hypothetical protein